MDKGYTMKIKRTRKGNIQLTVTEEQANAIRNLVGRSNRTARTNMIINLGGFWTIPEDDTLLQVYHMIDDFNNQVQE